MTTRTSLLSAAAALMLIGGCSEVSPPAMSSSEPPAQAQVATTQADPPAPPPAAVPARPATTAPASMPHAAAPESTVARFLGLHGPKPTHWEWRPPDNSMRAANYLVRPADGGATSDVVVFFFGTNQGGTNQANIDRWAGQFIAPDGGAATPKTETLTVDGMPVTLVELTGAYAGMGMTQPEPDTLFLAAIVTAPIGNAYIRLTGNTAAVERERDAFMTLVRGLRRDAPSP